MLHDLSGIKPKAYYVDTIEKFDALYEKLLESPIVATDTETKNLSSNFNSLYLAQFAFSTKLGYVVPVMHPQGPFSEEETAYIVKKLRKFLLLKDSKTLVNYMK